MKEKSTAKFTYAKPKSKMVQNKHLRISSGAIVLQGRTEAKEINSRKNIKHQPARSITKLERTNIPNESQIVSVTQPMKHMRSKSTARLAQPVVYKKEQVVHT